MWRREKKHEPKIAISRFDIVIIFIIIVVVLRGNSFSYTCARQICYCFQNWSKTVRGGLKPSLSIKFSIVAQASYLPAPNGHLCHKPETHARCCCCKSPTVDRQLLLLQFRGRELITYYITYPSLPLKDTDEGKDGGGDLGTVSI